MRMHVKSAGNGGNGCMSDEYDFDKMTMSEIVEAARKEAIRQLEEEKNARE